MRNKEARTITGLRIGDIEMFEVIQRRELELNGSGFFYLTIEGFGVKIEIQVTEAQYNDCTRQTRLELLKER